MRTAACPICGSVTELLIDLEFGPKPGLPSVAPIRYCGGDDFAFVGAGDQYGYDDYYCRTTNDTVHDETEGASFNLVTAQALIKAKLGPSPRCVLDFGCGAGHLTCAMAAASPGSQFFGCDVNGAALEAAMVRGVALSNLSFGTLVEARTAGPFDALVISQVAEHIVDFDRLTDALDLLRDGGLLYVEVPDASAYETQDRLEYLYYFDRLHVNHFTPRALSALLGFRGFGEVETIRRSFTYRDGAPYPALCMVFRKSAARRRPAPASQNLRASLRRYIERERRRCAASADALAAYPAVLVWGAGDNFHRAALSGGPLSRIQRLVLLDRESMPVTFKGTLHRTEIPEPAIRNSPWPVVITVSEHRAAIQARVAEIDPDRAVFCI
jgi:SAM-dependent methyltransferase